MWIVMGAAFPLLTFFLFWFYSPPVASVIGMVARFMTTLPNIGHRCDISRPKCLWHHKGTYPFVLFLIDNFLLKCMIFYAVSIVEWKVSQRDDNSVYSFLRKSDLYITILNDCSLWLSKHFRSIDIFLSLKCKKNLGLSCTFTFHSMQNKQK